MSWLPACCLPFVYFRHQLSRLLGFQRIGNILPSARVNKANMRWNGMHVIESTQGNTINKKNIAGKRQDRGKWKATGKQKERSERKSLKNALYYSRTSTRGEQLFGFQLIFTRRRVKQAQALSPRHKESAPWWTKINADLQPWSRFIFSLPAPQHCRYQPPSRRLLPPEKHTLRRGTRLLARLQCLTGSKAGR